MVARRTAGFAGLQCIAQVLLDLEELIQVLRVIGVQDLDLQIAALLRVRGRRTGQHEHCGETRAEQSFEQCTEILAGHTAFAYHGPLQTIA